MDTVLRALLQHPEFTYRVEIGTATTDPFVFALNDYEIATRLWFLLWGTTPDDGLLDLAAAGRTTSPCGCARRGKPVASGFRFSLSAASLEKGASPVRIGVLAR